LLGATALSLPFVRRARAEEAVLNIYHWADSFGETTLSEFEAETGIAISYDNFTSVEESEAKLMTGNTGYDIVSIVGANLPYLAQAGVLAKLDRSKLPSWSNLDPQILALLAHWDPGNAHGYPINWGSVGMAYNVDLVREVLPDANLNSLGLILDPQTAEALSQCGITLLDSPTDVIPLVLTFLGRDGNSGAPEDLQAVAEQIARVRPHIRTFDNTSVIGMLANQEVCAANVWSGDFAAAQARAVEAGLNLNLEYVIPQSGAPAWVGTFCIPSDAPHPENAHRFLEFLSRPEVAAGIANYTYYANANLGSKAFIAPEILSNPAIYPSDEARARLWTPDALSAETLRNFTRIWTSIKAG
jgi:putrescine transport system substrate-binding protein